MISLLKNKGIQKYSFIWLLIWLVVMGGNLIFLKPMGYDYLHEPEFMTTFFLVSSLLGYLMLNGIDRPLSLPYSTKQISLSLFCLLFFYWASKGIATFIPLQDSVYQTLIEKDFQYPLLTPSVIITKLADIIFQQTMIISMVLYLKNECKNLKEVVTTFTFIFFILHIPLFLHFGLFALSFIIPSLFAGIIFSYFISNSNWGMPLSILIHQAFYLAIAAAERLSLI